MAALRPWLSLVRFEDYGPLFLLSAVSGALLARGALTLRLLDLLLFVGSASIAAFVLNDVTDAPYDSSRTYVRNPIARGQLSPRSATTLFLFLAVASVILALPLGPIEITLATLLFFLSWGYSLGLRFKAHPLSDIVVHAAVPSTFVLMGYCLYEPISAGSLLLAAAVASYSALSGTLQEMRDVRTDPLDRKTTVAVLGVSASFSLVLALATCGIALFCALILTRYLSPLFVIFLPFGVPLVTPLLQARDGRIDLPSAIQKVRTRGSLLAIGIVALYLITILI